MNHLEGKTVLLTGGAGGIGFESAKAFAQMGAKTIIADIDGAKGTKAAESINCDYPNTTFFHPVDLSNETQVILLCEDIISKYGCPHIVFNNATIAPLGKVEQIDIVIWDKSYAVNLKAPIIFVNYFLPHMKKINDGCFAFVSSSGAAPFMGAYETFKTSQVELANTLAMELDGTNIHAYTIGPGLVKTKTAQKSIEVISSQMGIDIDAFYAMNESHILDVKDAGLGFALSVLNAEKYHGQEISSIQVLNDFNYYNPVSKSENTTIGFERELIIKSIEVFEQQYSGWKKMNVFERQWVFRDFKKYMGISADKAQNNFAKIKRDLKEAQSFEIAHKQLFENLKIYWKHQLQLLQGYEKDQTKLENHSSMMAQWIADLNTITGYFSETK